MTYAVDIVGMRPIPSEFGRVTTSTDRPLRVRWAPELGASVTLSSVAWAITPSGPTLDNGALEDSSQTAKIDATGFSANVDYLVTCTATCSDGSVRQARVPIRSLQAHEAA